MTISCFIAIVLDMNYLQITCALHSEFELMLYMYSESFIFVSMLCYPVNAFQKELTRNVQTKLFV